MDNITYITDNLIYFPLISVSYASRKEQVEKIRITKYNIDHYI